MSKAIRPEHLSLLQPLENRLKAAVMAQNAEAAEASMEAIQRLLSPYGLHHHRLLECRLWYFESQFNANHIINAESGFIGIVKRAKVDSRLYVEANFFLALCYLRQKRVSEAKSLFKIVLKKLNNIQSDGTRHLLQKRIVERVEQESILATLIGIDEGPLNSQKIHEEAVKLVQLPESELIELLGRALPYGAFALLSDIRNDALLQLTLNDRKLLPAPGQASKPSHVGKHVLAVLKRVSWKTLCDHKSPLYKLWAQKVPTVYGATYFASSIAQTLQEWKIGLPFLAAGMTAVAMKYGAEEFCAWTKPSSIMDARRKK